jgi:NitT/TauT family transport system substrate-binding protein
MRKRSWTLAIAALLALAVLGCAPQPSAAPQPGASAQPGSRETVQLKVGVLPILDVLPMYVAEADGFFKEQNLQAELVLFPSALERDSAFVAGQIDGELNDPVSTALLNKDGDKARIVRLAFKGNESMAMVVLLAAPGSAITSGKDLKGVPVGISGNTVMEYATDRLLQSVGLAPSEISKTEVTKIPVRAEMLAKGQLQAATMPEPLASLAVQQGAKVVMDDSKTGTGKSVVSFRQEVVNKNPEAIKRFLAAYEKGVEAINKNPEKYRDLMVDKAKVPDSLRATLKVPVFAKAQLPTQEDISDVVQWMVDKKLLDKPIPYDRMIAQGLLPN